MCDCNAGMAPAAFRQVIRRAKKAHCCCECGRTISPGDRYQYTSGIWDGSPDDFKTCLRCRVLHDAHMKAEEAVGLAEQRRNWPVERCFPIIGQLLSTVRECVHGDRAQGNGYTRAFRQARRALLVSP